MKKKILALALVFCLALALGIGGTLAYLTSTDTVTNTFTVGNVSIKLDEAKVNDKGQPVKVTKNDNGGETVEVVENLADATRVDKNSYKLLPGHSYTKDPTVTVNAGSEEAYVRMIVTVTFGKQLNMQDEKMPDVSKLDKIFTNYSADWVRNGNCQTSSATNEKNEQVTVITYEYRYSKDNKSTVTGGTTDMTLAPLFTGITVPGTWTNDNLEAIGGFEISIEAHAIQADGFDTADAAWDAFDKQMNPSTDAE